MREIHLGCDGAAEVSCEFRLGAYVDLGGEVPIHELQPRYLFVFEARGAVH